MPVVPPNFAHAAFTYQVGPGLEEANFTLGLQIVAVNPTINTVEEVHAAALLTINENIGANWDYLGVSLLGNNGDTIHSTEPVQSCGGPFAVGLPAAAIQVRKITALAGRRGKGRFFTPGVPAVWLSESGFIVAPNDTTAQTNITAFFDALVAAPLVVGVVLLHSAGISPTPAPTPVTSLALDTAARTISRRRIGD